MLLTAGTAWPARDLIVLPSGARMGLYLAAHLCHQLWQLSLVGHSPISKFECNLQIQRYQPSPVLAFKCPHAPKPPPARWSSLQASSHLSSCCKYSACRRFLFWGSSFVYRVLLSYFDLLTPSSSCLLPYNILKNDFSSAWSTGGPAGRCGRVDCHPKIGPVLQRSSQCQNHRGRCRHRVRSAGRWVQIHQR